MPAPRSVARSREHHDRSETRGGLVWRHLVGDYSLARSMQSVAIGVLLFEPIVVLVWLWSVAGTVMSALRAFANGSARGWAVLAQVSPAFGALATMAGGEQARIGFHRGRSAGESAEGGSATREERDLYQRAGLEPAFVQRIVATPNNGIWIPTRSELLREAVLTR